MKHAMVRAETQRFVRCLASDQLPKALSSMDFLKKVWERFMPEWLFLDVRNATQKDPKREWLFLDVRNATQKDPERRK
jgi:hypothetical protein